MRPEAVTVTDGWLPGSGGKSSSQLPEVGEKVVTGLVAEEEEEEEDAGRTAGFKRSTETVYGEPFFCTVKNF